MPYENIPLGSMLFGETFIKPRKDDSFRPCEVHNSRGVSLSSETTPSSFGFSEEFTLEGNSSHFDIDESLTEDQTDRTTLFPYCRVEIQSSSAAPDMETTQVKIRPVPPVPPQMPKTEPRQIVNFLRKMYGSPETLTDGQLHSVMVIPFHGDEPYLGVAAADEDGDPYPVYDSVDGAAHYPSPSEVVVLAKFGTDLGFDSE